MMHMAEEPERPSAARRFGRKPWPREPVALVAALARADPDEYNREKAAELLEDQGYPGRVSTP
jgi:hypothetical protein